MRGSSATESSVASGDGPSLVPRVAKHEAKPSMRNCGYIRRYIGPIRLLGVSGGDVPGCGSAEAGHTTGGRPSRVILMTVRHRIGRRGGRADQASR